LAVTDTDLVGEWRTDITPRFRYEVYEIAHLITNDAPGVFTRHNELRRRVFDVNGEEADDDLVVRNDALLMYQPFLEGPAERATD
jgi:vancomycin resistance protein VanW